MADQPGTRPDGGPTGAATRTVALVGPYGAGKTTLLEAILHAAGATTRKGSITAKNTVGDSSAEARARAMSTEPNVATVDYLGDRFAFIDCPGSIEFFADTLAVLPAIDAAVVVTEDEPGKAQMLQPYLKHLQDRGIPHWIFVNKIDKAQARVRDLLEALSPMSAKPLLLRQLPIWNAGIVTGYIDLALERAHVYREHAPSEIVAIPATEAEREKEARYRMLERLADYDDHLMEELLSDIEPPRDEIFTDLKKELAEGLIVPVLIGSAERDNGVRRLLKALRHECPGVAATAAREGVTGGDVAHVVRTVHSPQGKLSVARVLSGVIKDGATLARPGGQEARAGGLLTMLGDKLTKVPEAKAGDLVAISRLDPVATGDTLSTVKGGTAPIAAPPLPEPVYALAIAVADRKDEVKLTAALHKLVEEDPALSISHHEETHELALHGQGEIHLKVAMERLASKFGLKVTSRQPRIPYKETIRKGITQHARHKKQSGGHGQFGDVTVEIAPQPRGEGFRFIDSVVGGAVPRQYIPAVEKGAREFLSSGPLGFPVVDVSVNLVDGKYHDVDSSNEAFMIAGRLAMQEAMPNCAPVLLEPVMAVEIAVPAAATAAVNGMVSSRRGHIEGFDAREGWPGWDIVRAQMPQSELQTLIVELRSATQGVGTYTARFDHLAELVGKPAEAALSHAKAA